MTVREMAELCTSESVNINVLQDEVIIASFSPELSDSIVDTILDADVESYSLTSTPYGGGVNVEATIAGTEENTQDNTEDEAAEE